MHDKSGCKFNKKYPECKHDLEISEINIDDLKQAIAIKVRCTNCDFNYPPLLFPKFSKIPVKLWLALYEILDEFKTKEFFL
ncbi:MAG: hypothetical protein GF329_17980 [Candidatus Lokiarchaeota archaeon]|nr:hypothetical protein [Candidatus Lokiarchaeota archaeon]